LAGSARTIAYAADGSFRGISPGGMSTSPGGMTPPGTPPTPGGTSPRSPLGLPFGRRRGRGGAERQPLTEGVVVQAGEVVLARAAEPAGAPVFVLRAAAAAAQAGLPLAPRTLARLAQCPPLPVPWPAEARDALLTLLGAGPAAIGVWEALDQEGLLTALIPDWERVRNRPQRNPLHRFTVDRH